MSSVEKRKKGKASKNKDSKKKKKENEGDVLERVMDSIEMAGASLDFFEEDLENTESASVEEPVEESGEEMELEERLVDSQDSMEAATQDEEASSEDLSEAETIDMLDEDDGKGEFIEQKQAYSIIESLLFSSERPLGLGTFKQVFKGTNYKSKDIKKALEDMQSEYADPTRGVSLEEINGGWQLRTKVDNMDYLRKLAKARPFKLSGPALEVLAIIAYKQPMVKSEVDEIRGVESGHLVRALMEKHLVCFQGKSELPGKPMQYGTTRKFLEIFGLRNLRELPSLDEIDQLLPDGIGIEEEDEKLSDVTDKMAEEFSGTYSEGEEELEKIEATLGDIDTSSEFFEQEKIRQREKRDRDRAQDIREALDVGEEVEAKDQRWLERYDAKMAEEEQARQAQAEIEASSEDLADQEILAPESGADNLSDELSELSAQSEPLVSEEVMAADAEMEAEEESTEAELPDTAETFDPFAEDDAEEV